MTNVALGVLLQLSLLGGGENSYADAYKASQESGKPLVVLVGADWCPACQRMKSAVIPQLRKEGGLDQVEFAIVNTDRDRELAHKLMSGGSIPQIVLFRKTADGWKRDQITGGTSVAGMKSFLAQHADQPAAVVSRRD